MSSRPDEHDHDQDSEPPTSTGEEPSAARIDPDDDTPGSHPDPPVSEPPG